MRMFCIRFSKSPYDGEITKENFNCLVSSIHGKILYLKIDFYIFEELVILCVKYVYTCMCTHINTHSHKDIETATLCAYACTHTHNHCSRFQPSKHEPINQFAL